MSDSTNYKKLNDANLERAERYVARLKRLYDNSTSRLVKLASGVATVDGEQFYFVDYPELKKEVQRIVKELATGLEQVVLQGTSSSWKAGLNVASKIEKKALAKDITSNAGNKALKAFQRREISKGKTLSTKVWDLANHQKIEVELARSIASGKSADEIALSIQDMLKEPDKIFMQARDKFGNLRLSKGVKATSKNDMKYCSSYKSALRLARTEINMSYRNAELDSYRNKDYVVGFEIKRSTTPYSCPICSALVGRYPKEFRWSGWHPQCRCFILPITLTNAEMANRSKAALNGEDYDPTKSVNYVGDMPVGFKQWMKSNEVRVSGARERGTLPYFFKDNEQVIAKSVLDPSGRMQVGYVEFYAGRKYLKETDGTFSIYGTKEECERQIAQWNHIQEKITEIVPEFKKQCDSVLSDVPNAEFSGIALKSRGSAIRKADTKFGGDLSQIEDLIRCNFSCNLEDYDDVCASVRHGMSLYKDMSTAEYMHLQKEDNYICRFMNTRFKNGISGEIMVTPFEMVCARESDRAMAIKFIGVANYERIASDAQKCGIELHKGHKLYEAQRIATTNAKKAELYSEIQSYYLKIRRLSEGEEMVRKAHSAGDALQQLAEVTARQFSAKVTPINFKSIQSVVRKSLADGDSAYMLKDCVRNTIIADKDSLDDIVEILTKSTKLKCLRYKKQHGDDFYGYTGRLLNFELPNGIVGEIQVNTAEMIYAKEAPSVAKSILGEELWERIRRKTGLEGGLGHKYYEKIRTMDIGSPERQKLILESIKYYAHFQ